MARIRTRRQTYLRLQPPDLTELHVPFCAYKNSSRCPITLAISKTKQKLATELCLFVPAPKVAVPRKLMKRFGVPDGI